MILVRVLIQPYSSIVKFSLTARLDQESVFSPILLMS